MGEELTGPVEEVIIMSDGPTLEEQEVAQPDNREGDEGCLAVLNNFYNDGIRFHDVSCHHRKPIICEK